MIFDMFLDKVFSQYKRGKKEKPTFGSRFTNFLGRRYIGKPERLSDELGDDLNPELIKGYYYTRADRRIDGSDPDKWIRQSVMVNNYRQFEESTVALGTFYLLIAFCFCAVLGGISINGTQSILGEWKEERAEKKAQEARAEFAKDYPNLSSEPTKENCVSQVERFGNLSEAQAKEKFHAEFQLDLYNYCVRDKKGGV